MDNEVVGARSVNDAASEMGVTRGRIVQLTSSALRKMRWTVRFKTIKDFIDEYSDRQATE